MMHSSAENLARSRYAKTMKSSIFDPVPEPQAPAFAPAGKRRDQTTSEMFGTYADKELRGAPLTFVPQLETATAREKKLQSMSSSVMPGSSSYAPAPGHLPIDELRAEKVLPAAPDFESDVPVDAGMRRQQEMQSKLFGRPTPATDPERMHAEPRMTPTDMPWHVHQEHTRKHEDMTHNQRAYMEKCSGIFERRSPQTLEGHFAAERQFKQEERESDAKRRADAYYSDLFGRPEARERHQQQSEPGERRHKYQSNAEDKLVVHQDWTDVRTELLSARRQRPEHPLLRKSDELHQDHIFGPRVHAWEASTERVSPMIDDNSHKLRGAQGLAPAEVHQAHLRSSAAPEAFYQQASAATQWEVADLHLDGLRSDADDRYVRGLCQGFDLQVVRAVADMDPIRNQCKGRAKVTVRYNPERESIGGLVHKFESSDLKVEM